MISVSTLIGRCNVDDCVQVLVNFHRRFFDHPGYILNQQKLKHAYTNLVNTIAKSDANYDIDKTIQVMDSKNTLEVTINGQTLREYTKSPSYKLEDFKSYKINYPKTIKSDEILAELLYEITYYNLPQISG